METVGSPSLEIFVREPDGFTIWDGPPFANNDKPSVKLDKVQCSSGQFSEDGSKLMIIKSDSEIVIYDCKSWRVVRSFNVPNVLAATFSPWGTYLQTFQKSASPQEKNVVLWKTDTGDSVHQFSQKNMTKATWPSIRFNSDESVACRMVTNEVQFFDPTDFSKGVVSQLRVPGVAAVELSKATGSFVAVFVPESKGMPASVQIFNAGKDLQSPIARRSFFRCSTVKMNWNCGSTGLLILVQSDVDKTNQSYYGESKLNYLTTDGTHEGLVPLRKEGPVHDVQWSCSGKEFAVVYGFMPAMATIFDKKCKPILELGTGPYNTIRWNPKGKCLNSVKMSVICLAGFGNLPGDMVFWDYVEKRKLGTTKAEWSVTSEWSPDGQYFMTATTAPRRQIDNGMKIFHHNGSLYFQRLFDKLYQVDWRPESPDKFGDIAELVKSVDNLKIQDIGSKDAGQGSKSSQISSKPTPPNPSSQKPAAYRPPHAKAAAAVQAELFGGNPSGEMSKNALRNKKKREKQKERKAAEAAGASNDA
ncbi:OLC1v1030409C1 [Oldenlandia corymbosa var. corymbosa]|uniref:Eukaryotic translation initiation factor 2A n=1 Tax=Oldenlandia corymbosa var. corymbosa TaxID=529605 RepID=A0AAV1CFZ9_OLDCO|nr:OLC1v1030409C1 [Oldenlandia corymbosa var. corymbosa]